MILTSWANRNETIAAWTERVQLAASSSAKYKLIPIDNERDFADVGGDDKRQSICGRVYRDAENVQLIPAYEHQL